MYQAITQIVPPLEREKTDWPLTWIAKLHGTDSQIQGRDSNLRRHSLGRVADTQIIKGTSWFKLDAE